MHLVLAYDPSVFLVQEGHRLPWQSIRNIDCFEAADFFDASVTELAVKPLSCNDIHKVECFTVEDVCNDDVMVVVKGPMTLSPEVAVVNRHDFAGITGAKCLDDFLALC